MLADKANLFIVMTNLIINIKESLRKNVCL